MACYRLQCAFWYDSLNDRDAMVIDPVFNVAQPLGGSDDAQQLCDDLSTALKTWTATTAQIRTRAYVLPYVRGAGHVAESFQNKGAFQAYSIPRELAVCLSFYATDNKPRRRGRLYCPAMWAATSVNALRPTTAQMNTILGLRTVFTALGGVNVDWSVWSTRDSAHHPVTNVWVDDEWDVQRSRQLKPTARVQASTTEGDLPNVVALQPPSTDLADLSSSVA